MNIMKITKKELEKMYHKLNKTHIKLVEEYDELEKKLKQSQSDYVELKESNEVLKGLYIQEKSQNDNLKNKDIIKYLKNRITQTQGDTKKSYEKKLEKYIN